MINYNSCNCKNGYTPYILNGECRFCYGKIPIQDSTINNLFYYNKYYKILKKINDIITDKNLNYNYN